MARVDTPRVEPPRRKPRAGWAEAAKAIRKEQDSERLERALGDSADEPRETSAYRCVDLDIRSRRSLAPLLAAWPQAQTPGRSSGRQAPRWLLLTGASHPRRAGTTASADQGLMQLVDLVKALPPDAKGCWREATYRTFDLALDAPEWVRGAGVPLGQRTVEAVASVGGRIVITLYPPDAD